MVATTGLTEIHLAKRSANSIARAEKTLELDFFQRRLAKSRDATPAERRLWREGICDQVREVMSLQGSMSIETDVLLGPGKSRRVLQIIAGTFARRRRDGSAVHNSADRAGTSTLSEDNLLAIQPRAFVVTTDSEHEFEVYLNLASRMNLTGIKLALGS